MSQSAIPACCREAGRRNPCLPPARLPTGGGQAGRQAQSTIAHEPSGYHVGWTKRALAEYLTRRMGWKRSSWGTPLIENNPLTNDQMADLLAVLENMNRLAGAVGGTGSTCLYCGFNPCRCDEVDVVTEGLERQGVTVTKASGIAGG